MSIQNLNTFGKWSDVAKLMWRRICRHIFFLLIKFWSCLVVVACFHFRLNWLPNCFKQIGQCDDIVTAEYINNYFYLDPFADAVGTANEDVQDGLVHIRIQQRNGRKTLTTVQGLSANYDLKKIVRTCKKVRGNAVIFRNWQSDEIVVVFSL